MSSSELPDSVAPLFSREATWQAWLTVERALALTQGELGLIPAEVAARIAEKATLDTIDSNALAVDIERTMSPVMSLVRALATACGEPAGGHVHLGATTQNVIVTGKMLQLRRAHQLLLTRSASILERLAGLAENGADWPCVARTNQRHALPITFGYKVAGWIEEAERQIERLKAVEARAFVLTFGGASGAMHSYGQNGQPLAATMAGRLGLGVSRVHSRAGMDGLVEYVGVLGLYAVGAERLGQALYTLMGNEFEEVSEQQNDTVVGSSTMPHKFNPKYVVKLLTAAATLRSLVAPALETALPSHEGDAACNFRLYDLLDRAGALAYEVATALDTLLARLQPHPRRMADNLHRDAASLMSEQLMLALADTLGRQAAHDRVHDAIVASHARGVPLADTLYADDAIRQRYPSRAALDAALEPSDHVGESSAIAHTMAASARRCAAHTREHADGLGPFIERSPGGMYR